MSDGITFESGGKTWRYKDKPRFLNHGEYYWNPAADGVEKIKASNSSMKWTPVEPVEPEVVGLTLDTCDVRRIHTEMDFMGLKRISNELARQLREQGVSI